MKKLLGLTAITILLASPVYSGVIEDWSSVTPGMNVGTFADNLGSKVEFATEAGPGGQKAIKLTSTLVQNGWCGIWRGLSADLSKNKSLKFKVKTSAPGQVEVALQDAYNVQYIASCTVSSKNWTEVTIPLSSFIKNPYYTPPNAVLGNPMDLSRTTSMNLSSHIAGDSVVEIGLIESAGTAPASPAASKPAAGASTSPNGRIIVDWYLSPYQMAGTFADALGSKIDYADEGGPDGAKAVKLTSNLVSGGWCGVGRNLASENLSRNTCFKFKAKTSVPGDVQMGLTDAYHVQYIARFTVSSKDWTQISVPFSSFVKDPYYTPPGARLGRPMDLTKTRNLNFMPKTVGESVLEIGPVEAAGTGGTFCEPVSYLNAQAKRKEIARAQTHEVTISRSGGTPISPFAFGSCYFDWVDWGKNGMVGMKGSEEPAKTLRLNVMVGADNQNDANAPQLFDNAQEDKFIEYCRAIGAEPIMIVPVYGNNVDGGKTTAQGAADIVTYVNGTKKYGVKYWSIGDEVDIYDLFFKKKTGLPVSTAAEYAALYNSYAKAMVAANKKAHSGVELKFVGPELGAKYNEGNDWLGPMLDKCKDYIDVVSIHAYGFAARELTAEGALTDIDRFRPFVEDVKARVAKHGRPGTPLAITEANLCYDADANLYTPELRKVGPGTFWAAIWDADRMGAALEENLWTFAFWNLTEPVQNANYNVFGFILTDPSKNPPTWKLTPEYYVEQMVDTNFSGNTVMPSGVPEDMSVYASYDKKKAATAVLVLNKDSAKRTLKLEVDDLKPRTLQFAPMSINLITIPDDTKTECRVLEYNIKMADAGRPPKAVR